MEPLFPSAKHSQPHLRKSPSPIQDLTEEFQHSASSLSSSLVAQDTKLDIEPFSSSTPLVQFFEQCQECRQLLETIHKGTDELERLHRQLLHTDQVFTGGDTLLKRIELLSDTLTTHITDCKRQLDDLALLVSYDDKEGPSLIRKQNVQLLRNRFIKETAHYEQMQRVQRDKYQQQLRRQYLIINPRASEEQLMDFDRVTEYGQLGPATDVRTVLAASNLFSQNLLMSSATQELTVMQERLEGMRHLEQSVQEVSRLMIMVAALIQQQGQELQHLYDQVRSVEEVAVQTAKITKEAVIKAKKKRRATMWIILIVIGVLAFVLLVVWISK